MKPVTCDKSHLYFFTKNHLFDQQGESGTGNEEIKDTL